MWSAKRTSAAIRDNLLEQARNGVHEMRMPCETLLANETRPTIAGMNIVALAASPWIASPLRMHERRRTMRLA